MESPQAPPVHAPAWFTVALAVPRQEQMITIEGCPIHTIRWGERGRPGIVLVHGGAAHAEWWSFTGPQLAQQYDVVALDMSGHGESGRREEYPPPPYYYYGPAVSFGIGYGGGPRFYRSRYHAPWLGVGY